MLGVKTKGITSYSADSLEEKINRFVLGKDVIDIKYSGESGHYSALIIYKDVEGWWYER